MTVLPHIVLYALKSYALQAVSTSLSQANPVFLESVMLVACIIREAVAGDVSWGFLHPTMRRGSIENFERYPKGLNDRLVFASKRSRRFFHDF